MSDSNWCKNKVDRRSTFGCLFKYMSALISWCSRKETIVGVSSSEVEYIVSVKTTCQCLWLGTLLQELKLEYRRYEQLWVDNNFTISLSKNPVFHGRSKHIETKYHFLRDQVSRERMELVHCQKMNRLSISSPSL